MSFIVCLFVCFFCSFRCWVFQTHSRLICNCLICQCKCTNHIFADSLHYVQCIYDFIEIYPLSCLGFSSVLCNSHSFTYFFVYLKELFPRTQWCNCPWRMAWRVMWDTSKPRWDIYSINYKIPQFQPPVFELRCQSNSASLMPCKLKISDESLYNAN